ncbi:glycosyltransferase family 4 protein [Mycolicibacterium sarraceniae]|uniref:glycosyltransferase family 4 protein n=1 Tax=Mycolicibacterium sarraceniae TaxID=1534348 RepID=UPI0013CFE570|nr:glycosyltransferase family 4 protein [Mycolicibacterium sarraceniae]
MPRALWVSTSLSTRGGISTFIRNMRDTDLWDNWNIRHVATHRNGSMPVRILAFTLGYIHFAWALVINRPDIVHIHTASYGSFARKFVLIWTAKAFRIPVVLHVHGARFNEFFDNAPRSLRLLIRISLEHVEVVIALGRAWATELRRIAPRARIEVVSNAVRPGRADQQKVSGPVHVVFLGEIGERKGTFVLLEAWAKLIAYPNCQLAKLTIAGDGEVERARDVVLDLGIGTSVDVRGWLSETAVATLLSDAHVLVLPSLNEGQPMAILEAMSRGMCIIASGVGGIPEMLGNSSGVLIIPGSVDTLFGALRDVVNSETARSDYGARAFQRAVDEFNIDTAARRIDAFYHQITQVKALPARSRRAASIELKAPSQVNEHSDWTP